MAIYQDKEKKTWYCKFYYTDYNGVKKQKKKEGFKLKREAQEWERNFLEQRTLDVDILFKNFVEKYFADMEHRVKYSTLLNKRHLVDKKITPFFAELELSQITPVHVRQWQNELISYKDEDGKPYSQTYLKTINNQLSALFNYAVRYYNLRENPCIKAGSMGKKHAEEMNIWTHDEFVKFISCINNEESIVAFSILYYTGMRSGELLALTWSDIDLENGTITINKTYQRLNGKDIIGTPKTPKSNRTVLIFPYLTDVIKGWKDKQYKLNEDSRIIVHTKSFLQHELKEGTEKANLTRIRVHDLRHSHASLLIEMGFSPLLIAERLGHENIETTLNTYSHLYPNKQVELAKALQEKIVRF
jgi:integrase